MAWLFLLLTVLPFVAGEMTVLGEGTQQSTESQSKKMPGQE